MMGPVAADKLTMKTMSFWRNIFLSVPLAIALLNSGCERPENKKVSIGLSIPALSEKVGAQGLQLEQVVINVSAKDISSPVLYTWDACSDCPASVAPPPAFVVDVPFGDSRFIQVLAIYRNDATDSTDLKYGDVSANLSSGDSLVTVNVSTVGGGNIIDGQVSGRILDRISTAGSTGPTSEVQIKYTPPGKPSMIVDRGSIIAGWFSLPIFRGVLLSYEIFDGTNLFGGPVDLASPIFSSVANPQLMKGWVPQHKIIERTPSGFSFNSRGPHIKVFGYFGDSARINGKRACADDLGSLDSTIFRNNSSTARLSVTGGAPAVGTDFFSDLANYYIDGGADIGGLVCSAFSPSDLFENYLKITAGYFQSKDESSAPFVGPFRKNSSTGMGLEITAPVASQHREIKGQFLPGISAFVDSVLVFKAVGPAANNFQFRRAPCAAIAAGGVYGFQFAGTSPVDANGNFNVSTTITNDDVLNGVSAAICLGKGSIVWPQGGFIASEAFGRCRGCEAMQADRVYMNLPISKMEVNQCVPVDIIAYSSLQRSVVNRESVALSAAFTGGLTGSFYETRDCSGTTATPSLPVNKTRHQVYFKPTNTGSGTVTLTATSASVSSSSTIQSILFAPTPTPTPPPIVESIEFSKKTIGLFSHGQCSDIELWAKGNQGVTMNWSLWGTSLSLVSIPAGAISFHQNCSLALASEGRVALASLSPTSYYIPLAIKAEVPSPFDVSIRVTSNRSSPSTIPPFYSLVGNPLPFEPVQWFRASESYTDAPSGNIQIWNSRVGASSGTLANGSINPPSIGSLSLGSDIVESVNFGGDSYLISEGPTYEGKGNRSTTAMGLVKLSANSEGLIFGFSNSVPEFFKVGVYLDAGNYYLRIFDTAGGATPRASYTLGALASNQWVFVALKRSIVGSDSHFTLYVNGQKVNLTPAVATGSIVNWTKMNIGGLPNPLNSFEGGISELIYVDQDLSDDQIQKTYGFMKFKYPFLGLP